MSEGVGSMRLTPDNCVSSVSKNFAYYEPIPIEDGQASFFEEKVIPTNGLGSDPYEFVFEPMGDNFLCLNSMHMYVRAKVLDGDRLNIDDTDDVAPVNNLLSSMWRTIETRVNNVIINPNSSYNIPHKAMMESLLSIEDEKTAT